MNVLPTLIRLLPFAAMLLPVGVLAQTCQTTEAGDQVRVGLRGEEGRIRGRLITLSEEEIVYMTQGAPTTRALAELSQLEVRCRTVEPGPRQGTKGSIVGGVIGAAAGVVWGSTLPIEESNPSEASERGLAIVLGAGAGGALGGLVGRLIGNTVRASHSWVDVLSGSGTTAHRFRFHVAPGSGGAWRLGVTMPVGR